MPRLFVAIRPPAAIRSALLALMGGIEQARWQDDAQLHITLRFIGEVDRHRANDIADGLTRVAFDPFAVALSGVGTFDRKGAIDTLWAGLAPRDPLAHLHRKIDRVCISAGLSPESRAYLPHITLARFARAPLSTLSPFLAHHAALSSDPFPVSGFTLYESHLGHGGAVYEPVTRYGM